jgi:DNA repair exonuclease SbcCD ATPase subunit
MAAVSTQVTELQAAADELRSERQRLENEMQTLTADLEAERVRVHERDQIAAEMERTISEMAAATAASAAVVASEPPSGGDGTERVRELETELAETRDELEQMQLRLRRAYADAEDARAQLQFASGEMLYKGPSINPMGDVGSAPVQDGIDEAQRLRLELAKTIERASAAEAHAMKLQADLAAARSGDGDHAGGIDHVDDVDGLGDLDDDAESAPAGSAEDDKSLRFRLARTAARKKGIGDEGKMWS